MGRAEWFVLSEADRAATSCCVQGCEEVASIKQPLVLGRRLLIVHVPLCETHNKTWETFARHLRDDRKRVAQENRDAEWLLDSALALALFPPRDPL
jgi:hypothetical protein